MLRYGWEIYQFLIKGFAQANKRFPNPQEIKFLENTALRIREKLMGSGVDLEKLSPEDAVKLYSNPPKLPVRPKSKPAGIEALPLKDPELREQALKNKLEAQNMQSRERLLEKKDLEIDNPEDMFAGGGQVGDGTKPSAAENTPSQEIINRMIAQIKDMSKRGADIDTIKSITGASDQMIKDVLGKAMGGRVGFMAGGILKAKKILDTAKKLKKGKTKKIKGEVLEDGTPDYEYYSEILDDAENQFVKGNETLEQLEKMVKEKKDFMGYMYQQYKMGKLDPKPGEVNRSRLNFLKNKLDEAEMSGDKRLITEDEIYELNDLEKRFRKIDLEEKVQDLNKKITGDEITELKDLTDTGYASGGLITMFMRK